MQQQIDHILQRIGMGDAACAALTQTESALTGNAQWERLMTLSLTELPAEQRRELEQSLIDLAVDTGLSHYTVQLLYLVSHLPSLQALYASKGIDEQYFYDAADDLRIKTNECVERFGVCGTNSFGWFLPFYRLTLMSFGRLTYEKRLYREDEPYALGPLTIHPGDPVLGLHIPSGLPFDRARRMDSYEKAFRFFGCTSEKPLIVHCNSWLISPDHRDMLPETSNIVDFMNDFDMLGSTEREGFPDAWRIFGAAGDLPVDQWPIDNALRRGYVNLLKSGKNARNGRGILIFDGEKLLTGHH